MAEYGVIEYAKDLGEKLGVTVIPGGETKKVDGKIYIDPFDAVEISMMTDVSVYDVVYLFVYHEHMHNILEEKLDKIIAELFPFLPVKEWRFYSFTTLYLKLYPPGKPPRVPEIPRNLLFRIESDLVSIVEDYYINTILYREVVDDPERYTRARIALNKISPYRSIRDIGRIMEVLSTLSLRPYVVLVNNLNLLIRVGTISLATLSSGYEPGGVMEYLRKHELYEAYTKIRSILSKIGKIEDLPDAYDELVGVVVDYALKRAGMY